MAHAVSYLWRTASAPQISCFICGARAGAPQIPLISGVSLVAHHGAPLISDFGAPLINDFDAPLVAFFLLV